MKLMKGKALRKHSLHEKTADNKMLQISTKNPFKTIISEHLHTSAGGARDKTPGLFHVLDRIKYFGRGFESSNWVLIRGVFKNVFQHRYFLYIFNNNQHL